MHVIAGYILPREKLPLEFTCICMAGAALDQAAKQLVLIFELNEVLGGI